MCILPARPTWLCLPVLLLLAGCTGNRPADRPDDAFAPYITGFTTGYISARAPVQVRLAEGLALKDTSQATLQKLFSLAPATEGSVAWQDGRTLAFRPRERLAQGREYRVTFHLERLAEVPSNLADFKFAVNTYEQGIELNLEDMYPSTPADLRRQRVVMAVFTSDDATGQDLEGAVTASQNGRKLKLNWEHEPGGTQHRAVADSVQRGEQAGQVEFTWDERKIGGKEKGSLNVDIPALGNFSLVRSTTTSEGEQSATLLFSDPIDPAQNLAGLAGILETEAVRAAVSGNKLILYPLERLTGEQRAFVAAGLKNTAGKLLGSELNVDLFFQEAKPDVRAVGTGNILPGTDGLLFPFEAVNLNAVDVRVVKIYADNVPQFLQVNDMDGDDNLTQVGRLVMTKTLPLGGSDGIRTGQWQRYYLDLDKLMRTEPGAIYRIIIGFRRAYSTYPCAGGTVPAEPLMAARPAEPSDDTWDSPYGYFYDNDYEDGEPYYWRDRDDPCTASYFREKGMALQRNVLASDLGLIAKRGNDGSLLLAVSDLRTTAPMGGVELKVLDLQRRVMATVKTGSDGLASVANTPHKPFLLTAAKGAQRGYLKLADGNSQSVSNFDVQGETVDKGLKGFLYGERGVWRPGDSLFLAFMLEPDGKQALPKNIPVAFELSDPMGRLQYRTVSTTGTDGTYAFPCRTDADAPTGVWAARVTVGGTSFHKPLRIETVKPNRLKILMDPGGDRLTVLDRREMKVQSSWLHGAPAKDLQVRITTSFTRAGAKFKGLDKFTFDDLGSNLNTDETTLFDGRLNSEGKVSFPFQPKLHTGAPAAVNVNVVTRVFEAGGEASMDRATLSYYPYASYAGLQVPESSSPWGTYYTDTTYHVNTLAVDANGKVLPGHKLTAQVVKADNHWWWSGDMDEPSNYMSRPSTRVVQEEQLTTDAQGRATFKLRINQPEWGQFIIRLIDPESGHAAAAFMYMDWPGYSGRSRREASSAAAMLRFNSNKEKYTVGDRCEITIPSSGHGRALVSLESGSRILQAQWIEVKDKETKYSFPITADMVPNIYACVTLVQPHALTGPDEGPGSPGNDLPIRLYGIIPIFVENPATHLAPLIACAPEFKTDQPFTVEVAEKDGKAMTYTLAIVDEGLLDLTRFKTPDPWGYFHAREALGVRTWDLYDDVIGAFGQRLQRVLALGGSDQVDPAQAAKAQRFKPVVRFVGPFKLAKGKKAAHSFTITNYVGSVRVMVVASTADGAYGSVEKAVPVRKPLMLLATLPRVVGPGETVDLPVTVFAMDPKVKNVKLSLNANDLFTPEDGTENTLTFNKPGEQVTTFRVKLKDRIGMGKVTITAEGAGERSTQTIEIDVRQAGQPQTDVAEALLQPGQAWEGAPEAFGIAGTNSAYLELSTLPPLDLGRRLQYLVDYPHGCLEQTTSKAFPQLYLAEVMELNNAFVNTMRQNVQAGLDRLKQFQTTSGGFGYWPGDCDPDNWTTTFAGHFMVEAERKGFNPPTGVKEAWLAYTRKKARDWTPGGHDGWSRSADLLAQAYRLYVLSLANSAEAGAMNRLRTTPGLSDQARWMLAAAYAVNNRKDVARETIKDLNTNVQAYREMAWTYGSELRDQAVIAEALMRMDDKAGAAQLVKQIGQDLGSDAWYSTQSTAWALLAVSRFAAGDRLDKTMHFTALVNGKTENRASDKAIVRINLPMPDGKRKATITNTGNNLMYLRLVRTGIPVAGQEQPAANGLAMLVEYQTMGGKHLDPGELEQGTDFMAVVTVKNPGTRGEYRELALTQVFPSGWEIRNSRLEENEEALHNSAFNYQDIRDDRVMTYFNLPPGESATYRVLLNAAYTGRFHLPSTTCSAMYDNTITARNGGQWVEVVQPGK